MDPALQKLQRGFEIGLQGLTRVQTQWRTADDPARWSIQQIVEHLTKTYDLSSGAFEKRIEQGRPTEARANLQQRIGQIAVLRLGYFPQGRQAPAMVMPVPEAEPLAGEQLSDLTHSRLGCFDTMAARAEKLFGNSRGITHPVLGPMSVWGWRRFHLVHGMHHLKQVAAIRSTHKLAT